MAEIRVTEEMRQAVYQADCHRLGHLFDITKAIGSADVVLPETPHGMPIQVLRAPTHDKLPYLFCARCGRVWIVADDGGADYDEAVAKFQARGKEEVLTPRKPRGVYTDEELAQMAENGVDVLRH